MEMKRKRKRKRNKMLCKLNEKKRSQMVLDNGIYLEQVGSRHCREKEYGKLQDNSEIPGYWHLASGHGKHRKHRYTITRCKSD